MRYKLTYPRYGNDRTPAVHYMTANHSAQYRQSRRLEKQPAEKEQFSTGLRNG